MDEQEKRPGNPVFRICLYTLAICYALYMLYGIVSRYLAGGEGAPSLVTVIIGVIVLLGGSVLLGIATWRVYRSDRENKKKK